MGRGHSWAELLGRRDAFGESFSEGEASSGIASALGEIAKLFGGDRRGVPGGRGRIGGTGNTGSDTRPRRSCCRGKR